MRYRNLALIYAGAALLWLQLEDNSVLPAVAFGLGGALLFVIRRAAQHHLSELLPAAPAGAATGLLAALAAAALMILKTGMHSHAFPDYPPDQILAVLERAPLWTLAGMLAGTGLALAAKALRR